MTVRYLNGFDWIPASITLAQMKAHLTAEKWYVTRKPSNDVNTDDAWPTSTTTGRFGFGKAVLFGSDIISLGGPYFLGIAHPITRSGDTVFINAACKRLSNAEVLGIQGGGAIGVYDGVEGICRLVVSISPSGVIRAWVGDPTNASYGMTLLVNSSPGVFAEDVWFHLQVKIEFGLSGGGLLEVRVNNETIISAPSTTIGAADCVCLGSLQGTGLTSYYNGFVVDDLSVNDGSGAIHNDFLGNLRVKTQDVIADGTHIDSTIGGTAPAATHWQSVNAVRVDDSKYVYSPTTGNYDIYDLDPNQAGPFARAVQVRVVARQDDSTQRTIKAALKTTTTLSLGTQEFYLNQNYSHWTDIWEVNPDTSTDFTGSEVNSLQVGFEIHS